MARSLILPSAEADVRASFEAHLDYSDRTANAFVDAVIAVVKRLEQFPESGSPRSHIADGLRVVPLSRFRVNLYYWAARDERGDIVTVVRVLREERDVSAEDIGGAD